MFKTLAPWSHRSLYIKVSFDQQLDFLWVREYSWHLNLTRLEYLIPISKCRFLTLIFEMLQYLKYSKFENFEVKNSKMPIIKYLLPVAFNRGRAGAVFARGVKTANQYLKKINLKHSKHSLLKMVSSNFLLKFETSINWYLFENMENYYFLVIKLYNRAY